MGINDILYYFLTFYACAALVFGFGAMVIIMFDIEVPEFWRRSFQAMWVLFLTTVAAGGLLLLAEKISG